MESGDTKSPRCQSKGFPAKGIGMVEVLLLFIFLSSSLFFNLLPDFIESVDFWMQGLKEVVIVGYKRTAIGSIGGVFSGLSAPALGAFAIQGALSSAGA